MRQQISLPLIVSLIALLVLGAVQLQGYERPRDTSPVPKGPEPPSDLPVHTPLLQFSMPPIEEFSETLARPLFYEDRQPPDPSVASSGDPQAHSENTSTEDLIISAIVLAGEHQFVLVQDPGKQKSLRRIEKGQAVGGWSLDEIRNDSVLLKRENRSKVLQLWRFEPPPTQASAQRTREAAKQSLQQRRRQALRRSQRRARRNDSND